MSTAAVTYTFAAATQATAAEVNTNFSDLVSFLNGSVIHKDGTVAFTGVPTGPATDPSNLNHLTRRAWVGGMIEQKTITDGTHGTGASGTFITVTNGALSSYSFVDGNWYEVLAFFPNLFSAHASVPYTVSAAIYKDSTRVQTADTLQSTASTGGGVTVRHRWLQSGSAAAIYSVRVAQYSGGSSTITTNGSAEKFPFISLQDLGRGL